MASRYKSNTDAIKKRVRRAEKLGIDETTAACVAPAQALTPVRTGTARRSVKNEGARLRGKRTVGRWGSFDVSYFIWLEIGARGRPGIHMLARAADQEYPSLADRIRRHYAG